MAHTKAGGSTRLGRDSQSKRLGIKKFGGQIVKPGNIIVRQRGTKWTPGMNVEIGKDNTIFSVITGHVYFEKKALKSFTGGKVEKTIVNVAPVESS